MPEKANGMGIRIRIRHRTAATAELNSNRLQDDSLSSIVLRREEETERASSYINIYISTGDRHKFATCYHWLRGKRYNISRTPFEPNANAFWPKSNDDDDDDA